MSYEFSIVSFIIGVLLLVPSAFFVKYSNKVADTFGGSYSRYQIYSFIALGISILIMFNIQSALGSLIANTFFSGLN
ncbi:MAG: hypothetical protein LBK50_03985 [Candidatus Nomurabacteria bacterium]|jgi:hypothetical protein|nr:hypothetical protein [Candidatus Nomurabacteria bacterium]